jgi:hypothetical protein
MHPSEERSQLRSHRLRLVMPLLALGLNELRLPTDADQNHGAGSLKRGDDRFGLESRNVQPCSAGDTMQFHIHHVVRADLFPGAHSHPLVVRGTPCAQSRASVSEPSYSRLSPLHKEHGAQL